MDDEITGDEEQEEAAGWIMTFADLMSLLMCFFVLLLAFSEMDVLKFKQLAGSMREAFGVQREIKVKEMPKGTSIIAQEFSPGRPSPTVIIDLRQQTTDETKDNLDFGEGEKSDEEDLDELKKALKAQLEQQLRDKLDEMKELLQEDIDQGLLDVTSEENEIVIRIREKGSFPSGTARIQKTFFPILAKIGKALREIDGQIVVSGHTDNIPIFTSKFPSNWILSAARAASVVHHLTKYAKVAGERIEIRAHGETKPLDTNENRLGRAKNRRVEISVAFRDFETIRSEDIRATLEAMQADE